jgi:hypothetical protein
MRRVRVTENFFLDEFIDPSTYAARGARSIELMDMRIILAVQYIRDHLGPVTVNNWVNGGKRRLSGLRPHNTTTGARWSQHKYGRAIDMQVQGKTPAEVHQFIMDNERLFIEKQWITTIEELEDTPTWTHIDCRYTGMDKMNIVSGK